MLSKRMWVTMGMLFIAAAPAAAQVTEGILSPTKATMV